MAANRRRPTANGTVRFKPDFTNKLVIFMGHSNPAVSKVCVLWEPRVETSEFSP